MKTGNLKNKQNTHEEMIQAIVMAYFDEHPEKVERMTMGICNEVYGIKLKDKEIIARLSKEDYFLKGTHYHIPVFKKLGINVPDILGEDYSKKLISYSYQFLSRLKGKDLGLVIDGLTDEQLKKIAGEVSYILDKVKTIPASEKFGIVWGDFNEFSDTWTERIKIWIDETIERGTKTGILNEKMRMILDELFEDYKAYFDGIKPITYYGDICSKNVLIDNGEFSGLVDLDGLTQGDPLEAVGRIKASWPGTHYGDFYTEEVIANQKLSSEQRKIVSVYALLNRISWACENGIQFNQNTNTIIDRESEKKDKKIIDHLYNEFKSLK